jgi:hypothetical protein
MSFEGSAVAWVTIGVSSTIAAVLLARMRGAEIGVTPAVDVDPPPAIYPPLGGR